MWQYPLGPPDTSTSLNHFNLGRWSSSGSDRGITHFFTAQELQSSEWEKKNKEQTNNKALANSSARRLSCDTPCIPCRLTLAWISTENSTYHEECWLILIGLPSLMLDSLSCRLVTSAVRCRLPNCHPASAVANCLLWVPLSNSSLAFPYPLLVTSKIAGSGLCLVSRQNKGIVCLADHLHSVT